MKHWPSEDRGQGVENNAVTISRCVELCISYTIKQIRTKAITFHIPDCVSTHQHEILLAIFEELANSIKTNITTAEHQSEVPTLFASFSLYH